MNAKEYFDALAFQWDHHLEAIDETREMIVRLAQTHKANTVLDLACGTGAMFETYRKHNINHVIAIDVSKNMVQVAKQKVQDEERFEVICADLYEVCLPCVDHAIMYNAYPHFIERERLIKKVSELLLKGGRFTVAHGRGRNCINSCHGNVPKEVTSTLQSAKIEATYWESYFDIDIMIDTEEFYMISGIKK